MPLGRIFLTLSLNTRFYRPSLSAGLPSYILYHIRADCPTIARPCKGVHRSISLMSYSLFFQQSPAFLVCLFWMIFEMDGRWPYSCCFVKYCFEDLFNIARSILMLLLSSFFFFSIRLVSVHVMHPYGCTNTTAAWKKLRFTLSDKSFV